ncbi:hypothetical protein GCM10011390_30640 [Aureimonas endophytica]|uniref:Uncharacterized protein n=2 Tax=Aureimonas endophytica TaxID=2027858 RepID=A0A917E8E8_9HYPH|nr:hypothetical protein GCM10011390_30640 [Aureimonas endophytica]
MKDNPFRNDSNRKARRSRPKPFDYGSVSLADRQALQGYAEQVRSIARKGVEEVFELGEAFADAKARLPKRYEEWFRKEVTGITTRTASNYIGVYERFNERREQIVALGLKPSSLYKLAAAPEPAIEEVLGRAEAGEKVLGADVTRIVRLHAEPADEVERVSPADRGGPKGFKALLAERLTHWQREWTERATELLDVLDDLVPPGASGFRGTKPDVDKAIGLRSLWLHVELARMTGASFANKADDRLGVPYMQGRDWPSEPWRLLHHSLGHVGAASSWSKGKLFEEVTGTLIPRLRWALGGASSPTEFDDVFPTPDEDGSEDSAEADE